jgi:ketosteroid isomerase-like protein
MSTTPIITGDRSAPPDTSGSRRTRWIVGIAILAIAMVAGLWFIGTPGGGPDAFPVLDDEAVAEANALVEFLLGYEATWDAGDLEAFAAYLADDDFEFVEPGSHIRSKQIFVDFMRPSFHPGVSGGIDRRVHVGSGEAVESYLGWGFGPVTEENPVVEADLFTIEDGLITSIHSMYDPALSRFVYGVDPTDLLTAYASAWSSGDPDALPPLYAPDVVRAEGLFGVELRGVDAITRHAGAFFARHPGATWTIVEPYVFTSGLLSGAVFNFAEPRGCDLQMTVLVEMDDAGLIASERIYHDVPAIRACGWQR